MDCSPPGSSLHGDYPGKNIRVGCHSQLQGNLPNPGSNPGLPHCRWILYHLSHQVSPKEYIYNSKYPSQHLEFLYSVCVCVCMCVYSTSISTNIKVLYGDYLHSPLPHNVLYSPFWLGYLYHIYISFIKYFWSLASYLID